MSFRPPRSPALLAAILGGALVCSALTGRAIADPAPPFLELLTQSQATSPRLAESESDVGRALGQAEQGAVRPNPVVQFEAEDFSRAYPNIQQGQYTLSIGQPIELGGKRPARIAAGKAEVAAARLMRDQNHADYALALAQDYVQADAADRRVRLADATLALAHDDARIARVLVQAGREAELRALQADTVVNSVSAEENAAKAERAAAFASLTALAGSPIPFSSLSQSLLAHADGAEPVPTPDPAETPAYLAAKALREAAARRVRVEQTKAVPDVTLSVGVRRLDLSNGTGVVVGLAMPLPVFDQNRGAVSAARAELQGAEARLQAALLDAVASIRSSTTRFVAAEVRLSAAKAAETTGQEAYRLTRLGYEGGKLPLIEVLNARRALGDAALQTLSAAVERLNAEAELARLQGRPPFGDSP